MAGYRRSPATARGVRPGRGCGLNTTPPPRFYIMGCRTRVPSRRRERSRSNHVNCPATSCPFRFACGEAGTPRPPCLILPYLELIGLRHVALTLERVSAVQTEGRPRWLRTCSQPPAGATRGLPGPGLVRPWRALHVHAYRMLGSLDAADEAFRTRYCVPGRRWTPIRARRPCATGSTGSRPPAVEGHPRQSPPPGALRGDRPSAALPRPPPGPATDADADPAAIPNGARASRSAFITALQRLPARQRAALILRACWPGTPPRRQTCSRPASRR